MEANSTGGQGSRRAVVPSDDDDDGGDDIALFLLLTTWLLTQHFNKQELNCPELNYYCYYYSLGRNILVSTTIVLMMACC